VSEPTKEALKGAYETEPGNGEDRDDYLKKSGTKTYLIVEKVSVESGARAVCAQHSTLCCV
jgi:hypothetical protein